MPAATQSFTGFQPEAIQFLADLAANNERTWFQPRKADYERLLKAPLEALCGALAARFEAGGIPLMADPARSPFRIYRDVRFSKDKSPYKTHVSASFPWMEGADASREMGNPGGYFHLAAGEAFVGGGMWHPEPAKLKAFRQAVMDDPSAVREVLDEPAFERRFGVISGDTLKRVPPGFPADHPEADLLKLKDMTFGQRLSDDDVLSPDLPDIVADALRDAVPFMRFLANLA
ncbi:MAG: DUF2461 domain-containing protein [Candidatus Limnocylindrales bacterium]